MSNIYKYKTEGDRPRYHRGIGMPRPKERLTDVHRYSVGSIVLLSILTVGLLAAGYLLLLAPWPF